MMSDTVLPEFLNDDWVKIFADKRAGKDDRIDFDALCPEEQRAIVQLAAVFERVPAHEQEEMSRKVEQFLSGELSWAEFDCYPPELLFELAKMGQSYIGVNQFKEAEILFKGLVLLDHKNYHYRGMLGSIYQKQRRYVDAITEYSVALALNPRDIASLTNRGECWLKAGVEAEALADFAKAIELGSKKVDPWANRARILHKNLLEKRDRN